MIDDKYVFNETITNNLEREALLTEYETTNRKGKPFAGVNLANQDYLALSSHPEIKAAARKAIAEYGAHSAGTLAFKGTLALEASLSEFLQMSDCMVFPTEWAASCGLMRCLVSKKDHIVIDQFSHTSLVEGARRATKNIHVFPHLSLTGLERKLNRIRSTSNTAGILLVTESLFSMDSKSPDIRSHQELAQKYNATLIIDSTHDIGCIGKTGRGCIENQEMLGKVDVLMGSFSKTFASNGGFVATNHPALKLALRYDCCPQTFSPIQASILLKSIEIICSAEGQKLRKKMLKNTKYLRKLISKEGFNLLGYPSAIIPVLLGDIKQSKLITKHTLENGGLVDLVEYPAVSKNSSQFKLQVTASHTKEQLEKFTRILVYARSQIDASHKLAFN
ncbi:MAG: aminotransferase class I/II-fold pyridoxal phosphate-dependent enzyme [Methyloprofundus sp.]|nr:aminotransferase class I/II-fold pyridoxal phosphate-dependent enzyme [Methyloprofundus sp.]